MTEYHNLSTSIAAVKAMKAALAALTQEAVYPDDQMGPSDRCLARVQR